MEPQLNGKITAILGYDFASNTHPIKRLVVGKRECKYHEVGLTAKESKAKCHKFIRKSSALK